MFVVSVAVAVAVFAVLSVVFSVDTAAAADGIVVDGRRKRAR